MIEPKTSVKEMEGYFVPLYEKISRVKIDSNENNYGPSPKVIDAVKNIDYKDICFYPYYGELSRKIADYRGVEIDNVKVTNGADESLQSIIQTYLNPGESLLTLDISFAMPEIYTEIQGGNVIRVPFKEKWKFPVADFVEVLKNPGIKIVYLASPNNPTGNVISPADFDAVMNNSEGKAVIIDETYADYSSSNFDDYIKKYDNLFVVRSFSKDFALAGLRLGYILSASANIFQLKKVVSPFSVNNIAMKAGIAALEDFEYFKSVKSEILKTRAELKIFFESLGAFVYESEGNFLLVDFHEKAEFVFKKLKSKDIAVKLFKKGHALEGCLRVTVPTHKGFEQIKNALELRPSLVFDMDGVLVDARNSYRVAIQKTFEKYSGKTVSPEEIQAVKNKGGMNNDWDLTQHLLEKEGITVPYSEIVDVFNGFYLGKNNDGLINNEEKLFDTDFFKNLSEKYNISIFTGRSRHEAEYALKRFNAEDLFLFVITSDDVPPGHEKPFPDGLLLTKQLILSSQYYYFGDTSDDVKAAIAAGYIPVGVLPPQDKSDELRKILTGSGADFVIDNVGQLEIVTEKKHETKL